VVIVKQRELHELLVKGITQARKSESGVLVSQTMQVSSINPLDLFAYAEKKYAGERSFWSGAKDDMTLVGIGTAHRIETNKNNRFPKTEAEWNTLLQDSVVDVESAVPGTGPVLLGGFSFDPLKTKSTLWEPFSNASLVLPKFLLTVMQGESWLTTNAVISEDDDSYETARELEQERDGLVTNWRSAEDASQPLTYTLTEVAPGKWKNAVAKTAAEIRAELIDKVVLSRELRVYSKKVFSPSVVLKRLYSQQPDSFIFAVERDESCFLGASPERLVKREGAELFSTCVAGSIARGKTPAEDTRLGEALMKDKKNLYEHKVVVNMIRNAMDDVCGHVDVPEQPQLYKVRDIQHLYTPVVGRACENTSLLSMVGALHPTPALGGFPKEQAMKKIRDLEGYDRGWYSAPVGWIDYKGDGEFAVAIRSGLLHEKGASLFAGSGIVGDSDPDCEYNETQMKFQPMLSAMGGKQR
jgi:menaquinone-specific isochorismate synthase